MGLRGKLTPEMIPDLAEFPGKAEDSVSGSGVGFLSWKSAYNEQWLIERHGFRTPSQVRAELTGGARAVT